MNHIHTSGPCAMLLCGLLLLSGCTTSPDSSATASATPAQMDTPITQTSSTWFSDRDLDSSYDESQVIDITLSGASASCDADGVAISGSQVIISAEGIYRLSGTLEDGQIVINAADTDKVQLVLDGVTIQSATSAAIYALEADKIFVTLAEGSENTLSNGGSYVAIDDNNIDSMIFAKTDLTLNGSGSLTIQAQAGHGVVSKDDLVVTGKDSVAIAGGTFAITSGKDGIHAENTEDATLGALYIVDGTYTIHAQGDAISASGTLQIDGGTFDLTTGDGSASVDMSTSDSFAPGRPGTAATQETTSTEEDTTSQKGIKGESTYTINGGSFIIDSADDCLHAGGVMVLAAGEFDLSSGDDAVHCDDALTIQSGTFTIQSGTFTIPYCYEGIEGLSITIEDGVFDVTSNDDGLNAAGGADSSGFGGFGGRPQDTFASSSDSFIIINGGTITIVSGGDSVDSNGDLTINGGDVTTNDGSESNPGGMTGGGGGGMGGQRPDRGGGQHPSTSEETTPAA